MPLLSGITGFLDKYVLGYALGTAAGPSLEPFVQDLANEAWATTQNLPLDAETAAAVAAEDVASYDRMAAEATLTGVNGGRFKDLYGETLNAPGAGELFQLWRRGLIDDTTFAHGLRKAKLETLWDTPLRGLHDVLLSSEELAMMQQQGFVDSGRANSEGALQGVTEERQQLRFEASGLPPGITEGLSLLNRGVIDEATFAQIVREGHTKTKYTADLLELRRHLLTGSEYQEAALRGIITPAEADAGAALSGYTTDDAHLLFEIMGRPLVVHQITTGLARGGKYPSTYDDVPAGPYRDSIRRSNTRPEFASIAYANRYTLPSAFVIRGLVAAGDLSSADAEELFVQSGWPPDLAHKVATNLGGGSSTGDKHVGKAETQLWSRAHSSYVNGEVDDADVESALTAAGVSAAAIPAVLHLWQAERDLIRRQLTATQLRKAWRQNVTNPATGQAWTRDEAIARLEAMGYSAADADTFMDET